MYANKTKDSSSTCFISKLDLDYYKYHHIWLKIPLMSPIINNKYSYNCAIKDLNHNTNYEVINLKGSIYIFLPEEKVMW